MRIVSLLPSATEIVAALSLTDHPEEQARNQPLGSTNVSYEEISEHGWAASLGWRLPVRTTQRESCGADFEHHNP